MSNSAMLTRPIPSSGEPLPVIGCGTYVGFDKSPGSSAYAALPGVLDALISSGGSVIGSSPMYGRAEASVGELLESGGVRSRCFVATKVWTQGRAAGIRQMEESMRRLGSPTLDLMQVHNLVDWKVHLATLRGWKAEGRVRYVGITHYSSSAYREVEAVMRSEKLDFLQINYSIDDRGAAHRLLPLALEKGVAVLVNVPFGGGGVLRRLRRTPLPPWAAEIDCTSWPRILLKFVLSHPAVTCAIPGSGDGRHMLENAGSAMSEIPDESFWEGKSLAGE